MNYNIIIENELRGKHIMNKLEQIAHNAKGKTVVFRPVTHYDGDDVAFIPNCEIKGFTNLSLDEWEMNDLCKLSSHEKICNEAIKNELDEVLKNEHLLPNYVQDSTAHIEYVESLRNNLYKYKFIF